MAMILFELAGLKGGVAICEEEISGIWTGLEPGTTAIERMGSEMIVVVGEYDKITADLFQHADLRPKMPKAKKKKKKRVKAGRPIVKLIKLDDFSRRKS